MAIDEHGAKKKKERSNESFIVVRPPPSKTNHPLNLQVQLVPPSNRDLSTGRRSREPSLGPEADDGASDMQLRRTSSNRSDVSMYSSYSTTSFSSVASTSTTSSGRRMIIPLYNLQAHSVLTNVIVDAGTDAKVAKFQKRGLEVIGLAVLEPIEVWGEGGNPTLLPGHSPSLAPGSLPDENTPRRSTDFAHGTHTPTSSALSLTSDDMPHSPTPATPAALPTTPFTPSTPRNTPGAKKFFGKLFKRRAESPTGPPAYPPSPLPPITAQPPSPHQARTPIPSDAPESRRSSLLLGGNLNVAGHSPNPSGSEPPPSAGPRDSVFLQPPILGIQPSLSSQTYPPRGRPTKYVWVVRKWLKGTPESLIGGMKDKFQVRNGNVIGTSTVESLVEVRFEWARSSKKRRSRRDGAGDDEHNARPKRHSIATSSAAQSMSSLHQQQPQVVVVEDAPNTKRAKRRSVTRQSLDSRRSGSPGASVTTDEEHRKASPTTTTENDGDESDPEDSETPWTCTLVVRRLSPSRLPVSGTPGSSTVRVKVAGVVPTPHHPKVVALLKVPFPLPDIEVERVNVRKRILTPAGVARPALYADDSRPGTANGGSANGLSKSPASAVRGFFSGKDQNGGDGAGAGYHAEGLILTAEEIKDVVSSTALWLVVREGFGGVGKVSRKGDGGWRIR
ncbi:hypothetical protein K466DRAFT_573987 [Polyporus arcularius HHB13444]|uniref:Uncharacterized protein n=1 Tax=Polyporus arcularius HHB13444 TaxID=1314778 RepID=A0A5C3PMB1_9APHY|nr:hypothetical protein K466DRAFT_573987 [Polyporus arcularius HHB13444]